MPSLESEQDKHVVPMQHDILTNLLYNYLLRRMLAMLLQLHVKAVLHCQGQLHSTSTPAHNTHLSKHSQLVPQT